MAKARRFQRIYDHRLKELVHETGDIELAVRHGVPCSTARGWLRSQRDVVTLDVLEATGQELRQEILALRRRNEKLRAVLRILVVVLKVSGFSLANCRIPSREAKETPDEMYFGTGDHVPNELESARKAARAARMRAHRSLACAVCEDEAPQFEDATR